jgi:elongation factor Ts
VSQDEIPAAVLEQERSIRLELARQQKKPEPVMQKIVEGQMGKWIKEVCLLDQVWMRDSEGKKDIRGLLTDLVGKIGENIKIRRFMRYEVGEGLAKRADDFVDEVKRQAGQA